MTKIEKVRNRQETGFSICKNKRLKKDLRTDLKIKQEQEELKKVKAASSQLDMTLQI